MAIFDLFSKRQRQLRGEVPDVYQYKTLPQPFRAQVVHILSDLFGDPQAYDSRTEEAFKMIHDALCREYGQFRLSESGTGFRAAVFSFFMAAPETDKALDVVELAFQVGVFLGADRGFCLNSRPTVTPEDATKELNHRFREHGIGFQYESGQIIRVDSQVLHAEAVKPALALLSESRFKGANAEFLAAHEHHRHGRNAECLVECLKALESTLKIIAQKQGWPFKETDTVKTLIEVVFAKGLVPAWLQSEFAALRTTLESGVPTARNRLAGHGQGTEFRVIPGCIAGYVLHLTAASIVLLVEAEKSLRE